MPPSDSPMKVALPTPWWSMMRTTSSTSMAKLYGPAGASLRPWPRVS